MLCLFRVTTYTPCSPARSPLHNPRGVSQIRVIHIELDTRCNTSEMYLFSDTHTHTHELVAIVHFTCIDILFLVCVRVCVRNIFCNMYWKYLFFSHLVQKVDCCMHWRKSVSYARWKQLVYMRWQTITCIHNKMSACIDKPLFTFRTCIFCCGRILFLNMYCKYIVAE